MVKWYLGLYETSLVFVKGMKMALFCYVAPYTLINLSDVSQQITASIVRVYVLIKSDKCFVIHVNYI
jgi:hypothetical protein